VLSRAERQRRVEEVRQRLLLLNLLGLVVGTTAVVVSVVATDADESVFGKSLEVGGTALVSAALVSVVFGWLTIQETTLRVDDTVGRAVETALQPVREAAIGDAVRSYRWDCHLAGPPQGDPLPDYGYQFVRVSRVQALATTELRAICIASRADGLLERYGDDSRYFLRWLVDDSLDPAEPAVFQIASVEVDGQPLRSPKLHRVQVDEAAAAELRWAVPSLARDLDPHHIAFSASLRKYIGSQQRIDVRAQLFDIVTDAEFRLSVGDGLNATRVLISTSEVSRLGPPQAVSCGPLVPGAPAPVAVAQFRGPLQPGSAVSFSVDRTP
jgi:hypothetical protein